jgi:1-acyl-sn-glycerol-3-phosphate acyltransferase
MTPDHHPQFAKFLFPILRVIIQGVFCLFLAPMRVRRSNLVPKGEALLILSNHISNTDPILVQWSCSRLIHFMARRELFDWRILGNFMRWWRAFPVTQSAADTEAIKRAIELLESGHAVCVFPEGQLSPDGNLIQILPGASLIVRRVPVTCICVGVTGTNRLMPHPKVTPQLARSWLTATWGEPRQFTKQDSREEFLAWVESEFRRLTDQPAPIQKDGAEPPSSTPSA